MSAADRLGTWLQIVSNVGIVAGLVLVSLQMKQASDITAAQLSSDYFQNASDGYGIASGDDLPAAWARAQMNAPDLSDTELSVVKYFLLRQWLNTWRESVMWESGFSDSPIAGSNVQGWVNTLGNETAMRWWAAEHERALAFVPEVRDAIDARLREVGPAQREAHRRLLEQMRSGRLPLALARS